MLLYHYVKPEHVLDNILNNRLKISTMDSLNDPYEMIPDMVDTTGAHAPICWLREQMRVILKNTGLLCMSSSSASPAMWAHYADKHRGVAFEFEFPDDQMNAVVKVDYESKSRVKIEPGHDLEVKSVRDKIFKEMIRRKAPCWRYEDEYRWVLPLSDDSAFMEGGLFFRHLPQEWRRLIFGGLPGFEWVAPSGCGSGGPRQRAG